MNYAIIQNGIVENVIDWDGQTAFQPPSGTTVILIPDGTYTGIGATYSNGQFGLPPQTPSMG